MDQVLSNSIKKDFPIFESHPDLVYLDNSSTTQKPESVIRAITDYYENFNANVHRGIYKLSARATEEYENAHAVVGKFVGASRDEIIFTKNTTESLNLVAQGLSNGLSSNDSIVISQSEHHSNIVPWQIISQKTGAKLKFLKVDEQGKIIKSDIDKTITNDTKILSIAHMTNVMGVINPVKQIIRRAKEIGATTIIDGAQSVPHMPVSAKDLDCDFLAFSGHKMLGPTGIGFLFGKREILSSMDPFIYGGDMIREVTYEKSTWNDLPWKFEAGTPPIAEAVGISAAVKFLENIGMDNIFLKEQKLRELLIKSLSENSNIDIYGPEKGGAIVSFNHKKAHAHDVSAILDNSNICVRGGHHCAMPLVKKLGEIAMVRASAYIYNSEEDIDALAAGLKKVDEVFK